MAGYPRARRPLPAGHRSVRRSRQLAGLWRAASPHTPQVGAFWLRLQAPLHAAVHKPIILSATYFGHWQVKNTWYQLLQAVQRFHFQIS